MITISRSYDFEAAHCLEFLPDDHPCKRMHGHSYRLSVRISGELINSMVRGIQFEQIDHAAKKLLELVDHRTLNGVIENPSVENIAIFFAHGFAEALQVPVTVRVYEGPISWAEASA